MLIIHHATEMCNTVIANDVRSTTEVLDVSVSLRYKLTNELSKVNQGLKELQGN